MTVAESEIEEFQSAENLTPDRLRQVADELDGTGAGAAESAIGWLYTAAEALDMRWTDPGCVRVDVGREAGPNAMVGAAHSLIERAQQIRRTRIVCEGCGEEIEGDAYGSEDGVYLCPDCRPPIDGEVSA